MRYQLVHKFIGSSIPFTKKPHGQPSNLILGYVVTSVQQDDILSSTNHYFFVALMTKPDLKSISITQTLKKCKSL